MTYLEALKSISAYPVPLRHIAEISARRGIELTHELDEGINGKEYRLAKADVLLWLSMAPAVSQGGQNYSFTDLQRTQMRNEALSILAELEPQEASKTVCFGYKGSRL